MNWFKKTLAKVGVGSAELTLHVDSHTLAQGATTPVSVRIKGGAVEQPVNAVMFSVCCDYMGWEQIRSGGEQGKKRQRRRKTTVLSTWSLPDAFTTTPDGETRFDTELQVPLTAPLTLGEGKVWLSAALDIPMGLDTKVDTPLTVTPQPALNNALSAFESLGFRIQSVKNEEVERKPLPFEQRIALEPVSGAYQDIFREVLLVASREGPGWQLDLTFSQQGEGVGAALGRLVGANKLARTLTLDDNGLDARDKIDTLLQQISQ